MTSHLKISKINKPQGVNSRIYGNVGVHINLWRHNPQSGSWYLEKGKR